MEQDQSLDHKIYGYPEADICKNELLEILDEGSDESLIFPNLKRELEEIKGDLNSIMGEFEIINEL